MAAPPVRTRDRLQRAGITPEMRLQVLLARSQAVKTEIQWRGVQRDALVVFALTLMGVVLSSLDKIGLGVLLTPILLVQLASMWLHHDRRIGSLAAYHRTEIDPRLKEYDGVEGLDDFLNRYEPSRSYNQRYHFTSVSSRLFFPILQSIGLGAGAVFFNLKGPFPGPTNTLVLVAAVIIVVTMALTFVHVKHVRPRPA